MTAVDESAGEKKLASGVRGWERDRREAGINRRSRVARAVADLICEIGPSGVTHRKVAARAEASLSATSYYFKDLTALMGAGAAYVFDDWAVHSRREADRLLSDPGLVEDPATALMAIIYPPGDNTAVRHQIELLTQVYRLTGCDEDFEILRQQLEMGTRKLMAQAKLRTLPPTPGVVATVFGFAVQEASQRLAPRALTPTLREWFRYFGE